MDPNREPKIPVFTFTESISYTSALASHIIQKALAENFITLLPRDSNKLCRPTAQDP